MRALEIHLVLCTDAAGLVSCGTRRPNGAQTRGGKHQAIADLVRGSPVIIGRASVEAFATRVPPESCLMVLSHDPNMRVSARPDAIVVTSPGEALALCEAITIKDAPGQDRVYVLGGVGTFAAFAPYATVLRTYVSYHTIRPNDWERCVYLRERKQKRISCVTTPPMGSPPLVYCVRVSRYAPSIGALAFLPSRPLNPAVVTHDGQPRAMRALSCIDGEWTEITLGNDFVNAYEHEDKDDDSATDKDDQPAWIDVLCRDRNPDTSSTSPFRDGSRNAQGLADDKSNDSDDGEEEKEEDEDDPDLRFALRASLETAERDERNRAIDSAQAVIQRRYHEYMERARMLSECACLSGDLSDVEAGDHERDDSSDEDTDSDYDGDDSAGSSSDTEDDVCASGEDPGAVPAAYTPVEAPSCPIVHLCGVHPAIAYAILSHLPADTMVALVRASPMVLHHVMPAIADSLSSVAWSCTGSVPLLLHGFAGLVTPTAIAPNASSWIALKASLWLTAVAYPDLAQRMLSSRSEKVALRARLLSVITRAAVVGCGAVLAQCFSTGSLVSFACRVALPLREVSLVERVNEDQCNDAVRLSALDMALMAGSCRSPEVMEIACAMAAHNMRVGRTPCVAGENGRTGLTRWDHSVVASQMIDALVRGLIGQAASRHAPPLCFHSTGRDSHDDNDDNDDDDDNDSETSIDRLMLAISADGAIVQTALCPIDLDDGQDTKTFPGETTLVRTCEHICSTPIPSQRIRRHMLSLVGRMLHAMVRYNHRWQCAHRLVQSVCLLLPRANRDDMAMLFSRIAPSKEAMDRLIAPFTNNDDDDDALARYETPDAYTLSTNSILLRIYGHERAIMHRIMRYLDPSDVGSLVRTSKAMAYALLALVLDRRESSKWPTMRRLCALEPAEGDPLFPLLRVPTDEQMFAPQRATLCVALSTRDLVDTVSVFALACTMVPWLDSLVWHIKSLCEEPMWRACPMRDMILVRLNQSVPKVGERLMAFNVGALLTGSDVLVGLCHDTLTLIHCHSLIAEVPADRFRECMHKIIGDFRAALSWTVGVLTAYDGDLCERRCRSILHAVTLSVTSAHRGPPWGVPSSVGARGPRETLVGIVCAALMGTPCGDSAPKVLVLFGLAMRDIVRDALLLRSTINASDVRLLVGALWLLSRLVPSYDSLARIADRLLVGADRL